MPLDQKDTRRAIQLLRNYRDKLTSPSDAHLRVAVDRIIVVFESNLFKALLDIQRFYEVTLLNDGKNAHDKVQEALQFMHDLHHEIPNSTSAGARLATQGSISKRTATLQSTAAPSSRKNGSENSYDRHSHEANSRRPRPQAPVASVRKSVPLPNNTSPSSEDTELITLQRPEKSTVGFGFSIAGGLEANQTGSNKRRDSRIYITRLIPNSIAERDGRLEVNDIVLRVNGVSVENVSHSFAVEQLKKTGSILHMVIQHRSHPSPSIHRTQSQQQSSNQRATSHRPPSSSASSSTVHEDGNAASPLSPPSVASTVNSRPIPPHMQTWQRASAPSSLMTTPSQLPMHLNHSTTVEESGESYSTTSSAHSSSSSSSHSSPYVNEKRRTPVQDVHSPPIETAVPDSPVRKLSSEDDDEGENVGGGRILRIELQKTVQGLGFSIVGGIDDEHIVGDSGIFITKVVPDGSAAVDGRMRAGNRLLAVNKTALVDVSHQYAVDALRNSPALVQLTLLQPPESLRSFYIEGGDGQQGEDTIEEEDEEVHESTIVPQSAHGSQLQAPPSGTDTMDRQTLSTSNNVGGIASDKVGGTMSDAGDYGPRVTLLRRGTAGLGFNLVGGELGEGLYISYLHPGSPAALSGRLRVGDQILTVNGKDLTYASHEAGAAYLKCAGDLVELVTVYRPEDYSRYEAKLLQEETEQRKEEEAASSSFVTSPSQLELSGGGVMSPTVTPSSRRTPVPIVSATTPVPMNRSQASLHRISVSSSGEQGNGDLISAHPQTQTTPNSSKNPLSPRSLSMVKRISKDIGPTTVSSNSTMTRRSSSGPPQQRIRATKSQSSLLSGDTTGRSSIAQQQRHAPLPKEFHIQALFDYDASRDSGLPSRGLSFKTGDILHVVDATDDEWWRARLVFTHGGESATSLIPSHWRVERRERARWKRVNFNRPSNIGPAAVSSPNLVMGTGVSPHSRRMSGGTAAVRQSSLGRRMSREQQSQQQGNLAGSKSQEIPASERVPTYERVERITSTYQRPVVLLGALKENLHDALVTDYPDRFRTCVPHTTRAPRDDEADGRDYYFVSSREEMEHDIQQRQFIEAGQFNGNLYGTSVRAVQAVAHSGSHCILDVSAPAIRRLCEAGIQPIALLIYPRTREQWKELLLSVGKWHDGVDEDTLTANIDTLEAVKREHAPLFTGVLSDERTFTSLYARVKQVIQEQAENGLWLRSTEQLW